MAASCLQHDVAHSIAEQAYVPTVVNQGSWILFWKKVRAKFGQVSKSRPISTYNLNGIWANLNKIFPNKQAWQWVSWGCMQSQHGMPRWPGGQRRRGGGSRWSRWYQPRIRCSDGITTSVEEWPIGHGTWLVSRSVHGVSSDVGKQPRCLRWLQEH